MKNATHPPSAGRGVSTVAPVFLALACGGATTESGPATPYQAGDATLIGEEEGGEAVRLDECDTAECDAAEQSCGDGAAADVILDENGDVIEVLCYRQDVVVDDVSVDETGDVTAGNNTVLVLDGVDDGVDVDGDIEIAGNNAVVWGDGPDTSVVSGTIDVEKNNAIIRGIRIQQDVTIEKNDTKLAFCVIEGDLTITGNNTTLAECDVFGKVTITGLNTVFVQNRFAGTDTVAGFNLICNDNVRFDDANGDWRADDDELGAEVECVEAEGSPDPQTDVQGEAPGAAPRDAIAGDAGAG